MPSDRNDTPERNTWICETERTLIDSPFMKVIERTCRSSEDGKKHPFYLLKSRDWSNIIPVTEDGKVVMVRQFRIGVSQHTLEIPGGVNDPGDKDTMAAAIREMTEETGYAPLPGARCIEIANLYPNPAIQDNRCHSFVVGPVRKVGDQNLDAGEMIDVIEIPIAEIPGMIARGEIDHALILNAFLVLALKTAEGSAALTAELRSFTTGRL